MDRAAVIHTEYGQMRFYLPQGPVKAKLNTSKAIVKEALKRPYINGGTVYEIYTSVCRSIEYYKSPEWQPNFSDGEYWLDRVKIIKKLSSLQEYIRKECDKIGVALICE